MARSLLRLGIGDRIAELRLDSKAARRAERSFRGGHYQRHNARRQEHLASLGLDLDGKRVLEVGAGVGDHTTFFLDRGCTVLATEPRAENCRIFEATMAAHRKIGYAKADNVTITQMGVDEIESRVRDSFDIVYCYGLLYHLADPERALGVLAAKCTGLLLLETCVSFGDAEAINPTAEDARQPSQSFEGGACRPTRPWLFNRLGRLMGHVYVPTTQPTHEEFPLDWTVPPHSGWLTRAVFVGSRQPLANPLLLDRLPARQTRR